MTAVANHPPISKAWECHDEDCDRERQGYSHWCVLHRNAAEGRDVLTPCPCHGMLPSGMHWAVTPWYDDSQDGRRTFALGLNELLGFLSGYGEPIGGEEIADALNVKWPIVRHVINEAVYAGYVRHSGAAYSLTPLGVARQQYGNRGARQRLRGRASR